MRTILRKTFLALASVVMGVCLLLGCVFAFSQTKASAASALETEFTHNGQFTVSYYTGNTAYAYAFVDGASESLPAGYSGAVLKINSSSTGGAPYVNLDFTASKIPASKVVSVVARVMICTAPLWNLAAVLRRATWLPIIATFTQRQR